MAQAKSKKKTAKKYPHELTDKQWQDLVCFLPKPKKKAGESGRFPLDLRQVVNAILYGMRTGCQWSMLPSDYPHPKSVFHYYNSWSKKGIWEQIHVKLVSCEASRESKTESRP